MCDSRKACHHYAEGHPACAADPGRMGRAELSGSWWCCRATVTRATNRVSMDTISMGTIALVPLPWRELPW